MNNAEQGVFDFREPKNPDIANRLKTELAEMGSNAKMFNYQIRQEGDVWIVEWIIGGRVQNLDPSFHHDIITAMGSLGYHNTEVRNDFYRREFPMPQSDKKEPLKKYPDFFGTDTRVTTGKPNRSDARYMN